MAQDEHLPWHESSRTRRAAAPPLDEAESAALYALGRLAVAQQRRACLSAREIAAWVSGTPPLTESAIADALLLLALRGLVDCTTTLNVPPEPMARFRLLPAGIEAIGRCSAAAASRAPRVIRRGLAASVAAG